MGVLLLSPHLSEPAVLRRQIVEGVQAIVRLTRTHEQIGKIPLQIFDRRGGRDNVKFEQYEDLDINIVAELVIRAKQTHGAPQPPPTYAAGYGIPPSYGYPPAQPPPVHHAPPPPSNNPNVASILGSLGVTNAGSNPQLAHLLANNPQPQTGLTPDLARILGQINHPAPPPPQPQHQQPPLQGFRQQHPPPPNANPYGIPSYGGAMQQHAPPPVQQQQPAPADLQQILAGLTAYRPPA